MHREGRDTEQHLDTMQSKKLNPVSLGVLFFMTGISLYEAAKASESNFTYGFAWTFLGISILCLVVIIFGLLKIFLEILKIRALFESALNFFSSSARMLYSSLKNGLSTIKEFTKKRFKTVLFIMTPLAFVAYIIGFPLGWLLKLNKLGAQTVIFQVTAWMGIIWFFYLMIIMLKDIPPDKKYWLLIPALFFVSSIAYLCTGEWEKGIYLIVIGAIVSILGKKREKLPGSFPWQ